MPDASAVGVTMDDGLNVRFLIGALCGGCLSLLFWIGVLLLVRWL